MFWVLESAFAGVFFVGEGRLREGRIGMGDLVVGVGLVLWVCVVGGGGWDEKRWGRWMVNNSFMIIQRTESKKGMVLYFHHFSLEPNKDNSIEQV